MLLRRFTGQRFRIFDANCHRVRFERPFAQVIRRTLSASGSASESSDADAADVARQRRLRVRMGVMNAKLAWPSPA